MNPPTHQPAHPCTRGPGGGRRPEAGARVRVVARGRGVAAVGAPPWNRPRPHPGPLSGTARFWREGSTLIGTDVRNCARSPAAGVRRAGHGVRARDRRTGASGLAGRERATELPFGQRVLTRGAVTVAGMPDVVRLPSNRWGVASVFSDHGRSHRIFTHRH
ncbi:hypothetical protein F3K40_20645 [Streptomyces sp. LBUM 1478]|nr:hypothetical protein [Streptomyces sp. LBUM 1478]